jgi:hypothetical protein
MARMRSIRSAAHYFREIDADTAVTEFFIRKVIATGKLNYRKSGKKFIFDLDQLLVFLEQGTDNPTAVEASKTHKNANR